VFHLLTAQQNKALSVWRSWIDYHSFSAFSSPVVDAPHFDPGWQISHGKVDPKHWLLKDFLLLLCRLS
jgi:hypothetical protein